MPSQDHSRKSYEVKNGRFTHIENPSLAKFRGRSPVMGLKETSLSTNQSISCILTDTNR
jgi:hypothetical protein